MMEHRLPGTDESEFRSWQALTEHCTPDLPMRMLDHWQRIERHIYDRGRRGRAFEAVIYDFAVAAGAAPDKILHRYHLESDRMAPEWDLIILPASSGRGLAIGAKVSTRERAYSDWGVNWFGSHYGGFRNDPVFRKTEPWCWFLAWEGKAAKRYLGAAQSARTVAMTETRMRRYGVDSSVRVHTIMDILAMGSLAAMIQEVSS